MIRQPRTTKTSETNSSEKNGGARRTRVRSAPSSFFSFFFFRSSPFNVSRCTPFSSDICCSRPRDEPLSKNVRHCRRQLSPSGNSPPPPTSCFSFFFFLFCFFFSPLGQLLSSTSQPDVAPPRATESFTNFRCDNARCKDKKALSESGSRPSE